jgi:hypothetical protein
MPRKDYEFHYIYKTINLLNNKYYIGMHSTNNLNDGYLGSGKRLRKSIKKYGKENFKLEILEFQPNKNLLKDRERELITEELLNDKMCMNMCFGGGGGFISLEGAKKGRKFADNVLKEKYGEDFKKIISNNFWSELKSNPELFSQFKEKIRNSRKSSSFDFGSIFRGKKHTDETKKLIGQKNSINQKGEKNSQFGTYWVTKNGINKKIKKETLNDYISEGWVKGRK